MLAACGGVCLLLASFAGLAGLKSHMQIRRLNNATPINAQNISTLSDMIDKDPNHRKHIKLNAVIFSDDPIEVKNRDLETFQALKEQRSLKTNVEFFPHVVKSYAKNIQVKIGNSNTGSNSISIFMQPNCLDFTQTKTVELECLNKASRATASFFSTLLVPFASIATIKTEIVENHQPVFISLDAVKDLNGKIILIPKNRASYCNFVSTLSYESILDRKRDERAVFFGTAGFLTAVSAVLFGMHSL